MILTTQKNYVLPLSEKIKILGMRVETGSRLSQEIVAGKLRLKDNWNIQIIHAPLISPAQASPSLLEFPVLWEDEFEWKQDFPNHASCYYKKVPRTISSYLLEEGRSIFLNLTLEALIEVELLQIEEGRASHENSSSIDKSNAENTKILQKITSLEDIVKSLSQAINDLKFKLETLEEKLVKTPVLKSRLAGMALDDFRMVPIAKCIVELFPSGSEEPCAKIATDSRGYYAFDRLAPGTYEIRIKHPRYLPLVIKDYTVCEGENKYQDFILRRS